MKIKQNSHIEATENKTEQSHRQQAVENRDTDSPLHKGFKCLDISIGTIYNSRGITFDKIISPFSELHPNARLRLCQEILLLPNSMATAGAYIFDSDALDFLTSITNKYDTSYPSATTSSAGATSIPSE